MDLSLCVVFQLPLRVQIVVCHPLKCVNIQMGHGFEKEDEC